jgi:acetyltransferase-like isoleucine patch superfamily enzyme
MIDPRAKLGESVVPSPGCRILGPCEVGDGCLLGSHVVLGHPSKEALTETGFAHGKGMSLGSGSILRSGTVVYEDVEIGEGFSCGHHTVIREGARLGRHCVAGSHCVIEWSARLGHNVRMQSGVLVAETALIGDDVFIGPHVSMTSGRSMLSALVAGGHLTHEEFLEKEATYLEGPAIVIEDQVRIGANAVLLAGVKLGRGCVVAAGAVVSNDVPEGALVAGNPGRLLRK